MTITRVQGNQVNSAGTGTSQAVTLGSGITLGNLVVAAVACGSNNTTITGPSGWTQATINQPAGASATIETSIWYLIVDAGHAGQTSFTFTFSSSHSMYICISEWSATNGWQASPVDKTANGDTSGSPTTSTTIVSGTAAATTQASELWIASLTYKNSAQTETGITAGWTKDLESTLAANNTMTMLYQVASSTGAAACQYAISSAQFWAGCVTTFLPVVAIQVNKDTGWRAPLSKSAAKNTTFRGVLSTIGRKDTKWRGNVGHTAIKDSKWRAVLALTSIRNTTWRGSVSNVTRKDTRWRGNVGHSVLKDTRFRGVLANTAVKNTAYRGSVGHTGAHDTIWRANLTSVSIFYASNIAQSLGGLTRSDQMSRVAGGTEASFTVTMPASGSNSYVELLAQGGSSSATPALPSPTGKGWSINLAGNTILAGNWSSIFTLAKSGTTKTGASLIVRFYRRTMDGVCYLIGVSTLSSQTYSTTKTVYITPSVLNAWPYQFIQGDTLYMDAFAWNGSTAWASDVFTVYVSNSATQGVYNDAIIIAPEMIATPDGLNCLIGATNFQTGDNLPIRDQSIIIADAIDQRSIATLTGEDVNGSLSYQRAMPVQLSDSEQGLLYTGAVNSDKASKPAAGNSNAQLEHALTFMDNHYLADKRANETNYLNWSAGDMVADFIQSKLSQEGITGEFALESDYTPATLGAGTLSGTVATTTTSPFVYAPNTATPPVTSNTGDLELTRAGTKFTLTEATTSDFASGTLTNMTATSNSLQPTTQQALEVQVQFPLSYGMNSNGSPLASTPPKILVEVVSSSAYAQIWSGSKAIAATDTLNYDIWISGTSPAFIAGVDFTCSDGTVFSDQAQWAAPIGGTIAGEIGYWDQNSVSADVLTDLSSYAKDTWYTRSIPIAGSGLAGASGSASTPLSLSGKTITSVSVFCAGSATGTYTVYVKNIYLGSASGSPFLSTSATATNVNPPAVTCVGGYIASTVRTAVVPVFLPASSSRVSPSHSISSVGLVQNSNLQWTASLPTLSTFNTLPASALLPTTNTSPSGGSQPAMVVQISYDAGVTWLTCVNNGALPGLAAGANVTSVSFLLKEYFSAGSDPSAIPSLEQITITINSAAAQTTTDVVATYGNATEWNTGTFNGLQVDGNGDLTPGGTYAPKWASGSLAGETFFWTSTNTTQSLSGGVYTMSFATGSSTFLQGATRFNFAGDIQNGIFQCDMRIPTAGGMEVGLLYRTTCWELQSTNFYGYTAWFTADTGATFGAHLELDYGGNSNAAASATNLGTVGATGSPAFTFNANTWYTVKVIFVNNRHSIYVNGTLLLDLVDNTYLGAGGIGIIGNNNRNGTQTVQFRNCTVNALSGGEGTWQSANIPLNALGTCGNTQIDWTEVNSAANIQSTAIVLASLDAGATWQQCVNGAPIPGLSPGTNVTGKNLLLQSVLSASSPLTSPILTGLYARICGSYGTVTGTRISPALSLTPVGYVAASNCMYNANIPTGTSLNVSTTQDLSTFHTVDNNGAGEALPYWTNQPDATQDLFATNTSANYTSTNKSGGSVASVAYTVANSSLTLAGGSSALYLNNAISASDVDMLVDMDMSDAGGMVFRKVDASNFYEVGVYDASSSSGFTNQLRLYKVASGTRTLLGSASTIVFTRGTFHRPRVSMQGGLISVYWDGQCVQSYLDTSPLAAGACGLRNDGGTSRYYQLWIQPLGTNLSGQVLYTKTTMTTTDPAMMPQLFTLVACVRGPSIATGATISQLHPITKPVATYYHSEMDTLTQASGDYFWLVDKWKRLHFGPRLARPGAFPVQSMTDQDAANPLNVNSGYLLYRPQVTVLSSADLFRSREIITNVSGLVTPPPEIKTADGSATSWTMGYPLYSAPTITINNQPSTIGLQGTDNNRQFYWQPGSASISYDSALPKLPSGTVLSFTYVGQSPVNTTLDNLASQVAQASLELNSGIVDEITSALNSTASGMTADQATTFGQGLLDRYGKNNTIEMVGTTRYIGLVPGTTISVMLPEMLSVWNAQLPIVKLTTMVQQGVNGLIWTYSVDATNGAAQTNWTRVFYAK
jgi:hypothetical protein